MLDRVGTHGIRGRSRVRVQRRMTEALTQCDVPRAWEPAAASGLPPLQALTSIARPQHACHTDEPMKPVLRHNVRVDIFAEVRRSLKVRDAVEEELVATNRLLPPRWGDLALAGNSEAVASWLTSLMRRDFRVREEDILLARKLGRGARPLSLMGLQERLLYRGLVSLIEISSHLTMDRSHEAYEAFQQAPLQIEGCRYVLKADITAYYQYVDHERLVDEVVAQTGDDLAISVAVSLLNHVMGRAYGLPQLSHPSHVLSEIYIEPMRRALARSGFAVSRFADDFRVACESYDDALSAWEAADRAARDLGLVLNESKTFIQRRNRYAASLTVVRDQERELFDALNVEDLDEPEYPDPSEASKTATLMNMADFDEGETGNGMHQAAVDETTVNSAQLAAAGKVLDRWLLEEEDEEVQRRDAARVTAALLGRALRVFTNARDGRALEDVTLMLVYEPSLTPTIARYMLRCSEVDRTAVREALDDVCGSGVVNAWQAVWIAYVAGGLPRRRGGHNLTHVDWLKKQCQSSNPAVSAEAILALARRRLVSAVEINAVLDRLTPPQRPTGIVALAALGDESRALDAASSEIDRLRVTWAAENL